MRGLLLLLLLLASLWRPQAAHADAATEAQLRAALQTATTQIATLEDQVANLQASQAPDVAMIEALRAQLQTVSKTGAAAGTAETTADKAKTAAALAALNRQLAARDAALGRAQSAGADAARAASTETARNAALTSQLTALNTQMNSCAAKNAALFKLGNQILDAYGHKDDVFNIVANHEPFIGIKRVQLQNIVQNDQDTLFDNQLAPQSGAP